MFIAQYTFHHISIIPHYSEYFDCYEVTKYIEKQKKGKIIRTLFQYHKKANSLTVA